MKRRPILIITRSGVKRYASIRDASLDTGISEQRILRGLADRYGEIPRTRPVVCVDEPIADDE